MADVIRWLLLPIWYDSKPAGVPRQRQKSERSMKSDRFEISQ